MLYFLLAATMVAAIAAVTDLRTGHIPNWLTLPALAVGIIGHAVFGWYLGGAGAGLWEGMFALGGAVFCSIAPGLMFWKGGMGGGDLKLFAAIGALCQPLLGIELQMYAFVAAALVAPARLAYQGRLLQVLKNALSLALNALRRGAAKREVPPEMMTWFRLGPAIFLGAIAALLVHWYEL
jgi:prepilin peptidase CpaA